MVDEVRQWRGCRSMRRFCGIERGMSRRVSSGGAVDENR